jgi:hypothetical protein
MTNQVFNIIRRHAGHADNKYNILTFPTHERYETQLCKTGHNFYSFVADEMKEWNTDYAPKPDNYYTLPNNVLYQGIGFDFILSQSKFGQFQLASHINQSLSLPIVSLEHTVPIPSWPEGQAEGMSSMAGDMNVFISEYSRDQWNPPAQAQSTVVHHGVDTATFAPSKSKSQSPHILSVVNDFVNRDYCCNYSGWERITQGLETKLVGDTEGLSKPADSVESLVSEYNNCQVFLNTSTLSPIPTTVLEAMSCGCAVVSTATCMIPEIIEHGKNGMISNDEKELRSFIEQLLEDEALRTRLGEAARETIVSRFSEETFVKQWNTLFDEVTR